MDSFHWQNYEAQATSQQTLMPQQPVQGEALSWNGMGFGLGAFGNADFLNIADSDSPNDTTRRIGRAEWERHKEVIVAEWPYKTLPALQKYMSKNYAFTASTQQWKKKLREWNLGKNLPQKVARFVGKRAQSRLQDEGKKTKFTLGGHQVPIDKVKRHMQSYAGPSKSSTGSTPDGLSYETYKSPAVPSVQLRTPLLAQSVQPNTSPHPAPIVSPHTASVQHNTGLGLDQVQMAFWNGRDLDDLLSAARNACQLAIKGDYMAAKPIFMDCLDGLEVLLTPTHATFLAVLQQYVSFAVSHRDFDEATARVYKSYNDHKERLGSHDKKVWQCLARLGLLYYSRGFTSQAFHMLVNARQGLLVATSVNPEEAYNCVHDIVKAIISISIKHDDFDEAQRELVGLITQVEALGDAYQDDALRHKHDLVHLYHDNWSRSKRSYGHTPPNRNEVEKLLLDIIHFKSMSSEMTHMQTCCWDKLRSFYETTGQRQKLENLLPKLEDLFSRAGFLGSTHENLLNCKYNMISSLLSLGQYEKAEWWLLRIRDDTEN
ncbi:ankyrin repeat-containing protein [Fusarium beomiforme]|uniref:Ankyrin repeat-containing protein n=1 Tax=Fusarium beomiforme TaxID=44412 RepID=A0A9P5DRC7_9HYPO|nr:ankyrin repeat-containing protein [Fusarium beomiforme]